MPMPAYQVLLCAEAQMALKPCPCHSAVSGKSCHHQDKCSMCAQVAPARNSQYDQKEEEYGPRGENQGDLMMWFRIPLRRWRMLRSD